MAFRIPGLASLITGLRTVCNIIAQHQATVRLFVPAEYLTTYDGAIESILAGCDLLRNIPYADDQPQTNVPWGVR